MIKHVVMWRLKNGSEDQADELIDMLNALPPLIPEIKELSVGKNVKEGEFAADVALVTAFDSLDTLEDYAVHPDHVKVGAFLKDIVAERRVVDFEF